MPKETIGWGEWARQLAVDLNFKTAKLEDLDRWVAPVPDWITTIFERDLQSAMASIGSGTESPAAVVRAALNSASGQSVKFIGEPPNQQRLALGMYNDLDDSSVFRAGISRVIDTNEGGLSLLSQQAVIIHIEKERAKLKTIVTSRDTADPQRIFNMNEVSDRKFLAARADWRDAIATDIFHLLSLVKDQYDLSQTKKI